MSNNEAKQHNKIVDLQEKSTQTEAVVEEKLNLPTEINFELSNLKKTGEQLLKDSKYHDAQLGRLNDKYNDLVKQGNVLEQNTASKIEVVTASLQKTRKELNSGFQGLLKQMLDFDNKVADVKELVESKNTKQAKKIKQVTETLSETIKQTADDLIKKHAKLSADQVSISENTRHVITVVNELSDDFEEANAGNVAGLRFLEEQLVEQTEEHKKALKIAIEKQSDKMDKVAASLTTLLSELSKKQSNEILELNEKRLQQQMMIAEALDNQEDVNDAFKEEDKQLKTRSSNLEKQSEKLEQQTKELDLYVASLFEQTEQLEETTKKLSQRLLALAKTESKHFRNVSLGLFVVSILFGASVMYQRDVDKAIVNDVAKQGELVKAQNVEVNGSITTLAEKLKLENSALKTQLNQLQTKLTHVDKKVAVVDNKLSESQDDIDALNTGLSSPFFAKGMNGSSAKLHGFEWLQNKADDHFSVVVYANTEKSELYKFIENWGYYLDADVAFVKQNNINYLLFGDYKTLEVAKAKLDDLPTPMTEQAIGVESFARIKQGVE